MIYLNNAATTRRKPDSVYEAVSGFMAGNNVSPGRGQDEMSVLADGVLTGARASLARLFNVGDPLDIIFTLNCSDALSTAILGVLSPGDHIIMSGVEHNSVARPVRMMEQLGLEVSVADEFSDLGVVDPSSFRKKLKKNTKMIACLHGSNVTGAIQEIKRIGSVAKEADVVFLVDAAQTAGVHPIDVQESNIDLLAFAGHKGLMGPQGTGGLYIRKGVEIRPLRYGGTGSQSEMELQPEFMPDKFETGTPNTPGIAGLNAGVKFVLEKGVPSVSSRVKGLAESLIAGISGIKKVRVYAPSAPGSRSSVVSFNIEGKQPKTVAEELEKKYGIIIRAGVHCAPACHKAIGTFPQGTVRVSFGYYNTEKDAETVIKAVKEMAG